jgi:hypothetical protein
VLDLLVAVHAVLLMVVRWLRLRYAALPLLSPNGKEMGIAIDDHPDLRQAKKNGHTRQSVPIFISGFT